MIWFGNAIWPILACPEVKLPPKKGIISALDDNKYVIWANDDNKNAIWAGDDNENVISALITRMLLYFRSIDQFEMIWFGNAIWTLKKLCP